MRLLSPRAPAVIVCSRRLIDGGGRPLSFTVRTQMGNPMLRRVSGVIGLLFGVALLAATIRAGLANVGLPLFAGVSLVLSGLYLIMGNDSEKP